MFLLLLCFVVKPLLGKIKSWSLNAILLFFQKKILIHEVEVWEPLTHIIKPQPLSVALNT